jgi:hypothetical protein
LDAQERLAKRKNRVSDKSKRLLAFAYVCFLSCLVLGYLFFSSRLLLSGTYFFGQDAGSIHFSDFLFFYREAKLVTSEYARQIYDPAVQLAEFNRIISPLTISQDPVDQRTPLTYLIMAPLAYLSLCGAMVAWTLFSMAIGVAGLFLVNKKFNQLSTSTFLLFLLSFAASFPSWWSLHMGQMGWFLLFLICICAWSWKSERPLITGLALAFLTVKPHYAIFFGIPAIALFRWKVLSSGFLFTIVAYGICALVVGFQNVVNYPAIVYRFDAAADLFGVNPVSMVSIRAPLSMLFEQQIALRVNTICMLSGLVFVGWLWYRSKLNPAKLTPWAFALSTVYCLTLSPHSHPYDLTLLALPALLTLNSLDISKALTAGSSGERVWKVTFILYPLLSFGAFIYWNIILSNAQNQPSPLFYVNVILLLSGTAHYLAMLSGEEKQSKAKSLAS